VNALPRTIEPEAAVVVVHRAPRRKFARQHPPRATGAVEVEDAVDHAAHVDAAMPSAGLGRRDHRRDERPLFVREVRWVERPCHTYVIGSMDASHTHSNTTVAHVVFPMMMAAWSMMLRLETLS